MLRSEIVLHWVTGPAVLDIGCASHVPEPGSPYWLHGRLRETFSSVAGIDIHEGNLATLKALGFDNLHCASAESFQLGRTFDTIVAGELIEHLANPGEFLARASEHLGSGGRLVLTTPYPFALLNLLYALAKFPRTCQNPEHTCWFCPQTLQALAGRAGFRIAHWELIECYRPDDPAPRYRLFVRLLRLFRRWIPARLRCNTMLFVLEKSRPPAP